MKNKIVTLICMLFFLSLSAQKTPLNVADELLQIRKVQEEVKHYHFQMTYQLFDQIVGGKMIEEQQGSYVRSGDAFISEIYGVKTIQNDEYLLAIYPEEKMLSISSAENELKANADVISKYLNENKQAYMVKSTRKSKTLRVDFSTGVSELDSMEVSYDSKYRIQQIVLYMRATYDSEKGWGVGDKKPRLEINYETIKWDEAIDKKVFNISEYVRENAAGLKPVAPYDTFRFIDLTKNNSDDK